MSSIDLSARIDAMVQQANEGDSGETADAPTENAPAGIPASPAGIPAATIEDAAANIVAAPIAADAPASDPSSARAALIRERLAEQRERREATKLSAQAKADREEAARDREAAKGDRSKWEALKQGSFREGIAALGRDPSEVFAEMQREAIEASTPEAEIKRMRADFERQIGEKLAPLQETIESLKAEKVEANAVAYHHALTSAFSQEAQDPEFVGLRTEYEDSALLGYVQEFDRNPDSFYAAAKAYGVRLTDPSQGFTMREILTVLKAAQDAHDQGKTARRARLQPQAHQAASSAPTRTVNGTAERRNAGSTIDPDLAGERASTSDRKLSRSERIQQEVDRLSRR